MRPTLQTLLRQSKHHVTPDGDHVITLDRQRGMWQVRLVIDDHDEMPLFEAADFELCLEAVAEVVAEMAETDDDADRAHLDFRAYTEAARHAVPVR